MPKGCYKGYNKEYHEVYVYDMNKNYQLALSKVAEKEKELNILKKIKIIY